MNTQNYLDRIDYSGSTEASLETLKRLQRQHLLSVPFENLDIHRNVPIKLNLEIIYQKVVENHRGGFCYELNGLFLQLLLALNFKAHLISATVYSEENGYGFPGTHCAVMVKFENGTYLTDVGFGEFSFTPLKLEVDKIQHDDRGEFVFDNYDEKHFRINKLENDLKKPQYIFKNEKMAFLDFKAGCHFHQTNSKSTFVKKRLISRPIENGRITVTENTLKISENNEVEEREIEDEKEFEKILWEFFEVKF
jgi:N-hydroxyarylamine O-acetyltransferase